MYTALETKVELILSIYKVRKYVCKHRSLDVWHILTADWIKFHRLLDVRCDSLTDCMTLFWLWFMHIASHSGSSYPRTRTSILCRNLWTSAAPPTAHAVQSDLISPDVTSRLAINLHVSRVKLSAGHSFVVGLLLFSHKYCPTHADCSVDPPSLTGVYRQTPSKKDLVLHKVIVSCV